MCVCVCVCVCVNLFISSCKITNIYTPIRSFIYRNTFKKSM